MSIITILLLAAAAANAQPTGFITRQDQGEVVSVDLSNGSIIGTIPTLDPSPGKITLSSDASTLYVTNGDPFQSAVNIIDVGTASAIKSISLDPWSVPTEIVLLPDDSKVYTADWFGSTVSVIDAATQTKIATIPTDFLPYDVAAAPDGSRIYSTALLATDVFVIDPALDVVVDRIPVGRAFLGHIAISPDSKKAYISEFSGQVTVIDLASRLVVGSIPFDATNANPNNLALDIKIDPQGAFAYVLGFDAVNIIDLTNDTLVTTIPIGIELADEAIESSGKFLYVTTQGAPQPQLNEIIKIDTQSHTIQDRFVIGGLLSGITIEPSAVQVEMDIKPDSTVNSINPKSRGVIPVAILTTTNFDAANVDNDSIRFGSNGTEAAPVHVALSDVDGDGDIDVLLHFRTEETGIRCADTSAVLTGMSLTGQSIQASDRIKAVGCGAR